MAYRVLPLIKLVEQFERLPGIGKKSAQKLAMYVLNLPPEKAKEFANCILDAQEKVHRCKICGALTDEEICSVCADPTRDRETLCVVEDLQAMLAVERTREYHGVYHVLHGLLSPMKGIGPEQITIPLLLKRVKEGTIKEMIMATNPTVEGEATAMYISRVVKPLGVKVTRLAYGIPVGGDLEYADEVTLYRALEGRSEL